MAEQRFMMDLKIEPSQHTINYTDGILLIGSCFTEHIGNHLADLKFNVLQNPNGILFDPVSVADSLVAYTRPNAYSHIELFHLNDVWQSWQHHSRLSGTNKEEVWNAIQQSHHKAYEFLKNARWLVITLGTAFCFRLKETNATVANCHKAPANLFRRHLLSIEEINSALDNCLHQLFHFNNKLQVIFTVSPVRHVRDGLVDNNRSKARLIEVVHHLVNKFDRLHYFPAYELVIDVLRDYRFFDVDMVHPNYQATSFVTEKFLSAFVEKKAYELSKQVQELVTSARHRSFHPNTPSHQRFLQHLMDKINELARNHPYLDFSQEENLARQQMNQ